MAAAPYERPPGGQGARGAAGQGQGAAITRRLRLALDEPSGVRPWNEWDGPAWALRRLAAKTDAKAVTWSLRAEPHGHRSDPYRQAQLYSVSLEELERVDNLVSDLWRLEWARRWSPPASPPRSPGGSASARPRPRRWRRAAGRGSCAGTTPSGCVPSLAGGAPAAHAPGGAATRPPARPPPSGGTTRPAAPPPLHRPAHRAEPPDPVARRVGHENRVESWRWVKVRTARTAANGRGAADWRPDKATWALTSSSSPSTRWNGRAHPPAAGQLLAPGQLEALLEQDGVVRPGRWLRSLRDVGLVQRQADRWALPPDGGILHS